MLSLSISVACGAFGGLIVEAAFIWRQLYDWQQARHAAAVVGKTLPAIGEYVDPAADVAVAVSRVALGAVAGGLLHAQVTGIYAAVTVGASAPGLLTSLGRAATGLGALRGAPKADAADPLSRDAETIPDAQPEALQ